MLQCVGENSVSARIAPGGCPIEATISVDELPSQARVVLYALKTGGPLLVRRSAASASTGTRACRANRTVTAASIRCPRQDRGSWPARHRQRYGFRLAGRIDSPAMDRRARFICMRSRARFRHRAGRAARCIRVLVRLRCAPLGAVRRAGGPRTAADSGLQAKPQATSLSAAGSLGRTAATAGR
jgi:hypothetical protein